MPYDRETLRRIARTRLVEARCLRDADEPSGAYYLAGYAVECALKARIAGEFRENEIPERKFLNDIYTHDLTTLVDLAGLKSELETAMQADVGLQQKWAVIRKWSEQARYRIWTKGEASAMIVAVGGDINEEGLFQWLTGRW